MARKIISKKHKIDELNQLLAEDRPPDVDPNELSESIRKKVGGSISDLMVITDEHNKWIKTIQENHNPFIGKTYITKAPEYETADRFLTPAEISEMDDETKSELDNGMGDFNVDSLDFVDIEIVDSPSKTNSNNIQNKFIDHCIITNTTKKLIGESSDVIKSTAVEEMKKHHRDSNYESVVDFDKSIKHATIQLKLENQLKKLLNK